MVDEAYGFDAVKGKSLPRALESPVDLGGVDPTITLARGRANDGWGAFWTGRLTLTGGPWRITLDARAGYAAIVKELRESGGYAITHEITKAARECERRTLA
jgi:hypothetical protein